MRVYPVVMSLLDLPEEVIIIIVKSLDIQSQHNFYNTNNYFKNVVSMNGVITTCQFSLNTMATAYSLKLGFFKDIAGHLQELNLCAVNDLNKTMLLPAIKKLKKLNTLDVSYTKITILDLLEVHHACPTITEISINFSFYKSGQVKISPKLLEKCQNMFGHFVKVHFVGALINLFYSKLPLSILQKAKLNELQITITECALTVYESDVELSEMVQYKLLKIFLLNWKKKNQYYGRLNDAVILSMVNLKKSELIIVTRCTMNMSKVIVTHRFKDFFQQHFGLEAQVITEWNFQELGGNVAIMIWDSESTVFDDSFFNHLSNQLKQFFPYHVLSACSDTQVPAKCDWFYTKPNQHDFGRQERKIEPDCKRRRLAPRDILLNYDSVCKDKIRIQISIMFDNPLRSPVALSRNNEYLRKITFLSLSGHVVYSADFFKILFCYCTNLVTIDSATTPNSAQALGRNIPLSKYIKNLRLVASTIDFKALFQSLSQCRHIENVHLINEANSGPQDLAESKEMFFRCSRLYNLNISIPMSENIRTKKMQMFNKFKTMYSRRHLNIELNVSCDAVGFGFDPFISIFNLNPIKIV